MFENKVNTKIFGKTPVPETFQGMEIELATLLTSVGCGDYISNLVKEEISTMEMAHQIFRLGAAKPDFLTLGAFTKIRVAIEALKVPAAAGRNV